MNLILKYGPDIMANFDKEFSDIIPEGLAILRVQQRQINGLITNNVIKKQISEHKDIPCVNSSLLHSEIGEALLKKYPKAPFAAIYHEASELIYYSLRSRSNFDVSKVALEFGGGGHAQAAGYSITRKAGE